MASRPPWQRVEIYREQLYTRSIDVFPKLFEKFVDEFLEMDDGQTWGLLDGPDDVLYAAVQTFLPLDEIIAASSSGGSSYRRRPPT